MLIDTRNKSIRFHLFLGSLLSVVFVVLVVACSTPPAVEEATSTPEKSQGQENQAVESLQKEAPSGEIEKVMDATQDGAPPEPSGAENLNEPIVEQSPEVDPSEKNPETPIGGDSPGKGYRLTVNNGYGSGVYPAGTRVHIWARHNPYQSLVIGWSGDTSVLDNKGEWHTTITMPARSVTLTPRLKAVTSKLQSASFQGVKYKKPVLFMIPPNPKGLILAFHGTGGSHKYIQRLETLYVARKAYNRGYGVISADAEEVQAGDTDKNGKIRWNPDINNAKNPDFANVRLMLQALVKQKKITEKTPIYAFGMSNGGAFSFSVGHALKLKAVVSYCASGRLDVARQTKTPSMWLLCQNDSNPQVSNARAKQNYQALVSRKIDAAYHEHPASPLYEGRFFRIIGINLQKSVQLAKEMHSNKLVDTKGYFQGNAETLLKRLQGNQKSFPVLFGLTKGLQAGVFGQVRIMLADHAMYDDYATKMLDFFDKHP